MRTPAGKECPHYYEDYYRGRAVQECRLVKENPQSERWQPGDCKRCPVPEIRAANSSRDLELKLTIVKTMLGFVRRVGISASCLKHRVPIEDPYTGCPQCAAERPGLDLFRKALGQDDQ
ncbi:MAG: hypothetical protein HXY40_05975 [Chloroflexi bacterium]|nr:hypothetical protein [Chloroflexota bacterium]